MTGPIDPTAVAALGDVPLDWRYKGLPAPWWGRTPAEIRAAGANPFDDGAVGPLCVLDQDALTHNLATMSQWCRTQGVDLAPHGKTHMAPQLLARQFDAGAVAVTVATIAQVRIYRAFGTRRVVLANQLVDAAGLRWLSAELDAHPDFELVCWVDSVAGVEQMTEALTAAGAVRPVDVCVEVGMPGGRSGCRTAAEVDEVARAASSSGRLRLIGVAGYEAALGHDVTPEAYQRVRHYLRQVRAAVSRLAGTFETDDVMVTAGGSTYFDVVVEELTGNWAVGSSVSTVLRSGCYLTHDVGLYERTSPLELRSALTVWAQATSRPEPDLALFTMGRRDVSEDQDLPRPRGLPGSTVTRLNDQHAYLRIGADDRVAVGDWVAFGISHPCTTFDKWSLIPVIDADHRVVDLIRTFF